MGSDLSGYRWFDAGQAGGPLYVVFLVKHVKWISKTSKQNIF